MLVAALIAAVSFLQPLKADTLPEEITSQVPTTLLRIVNKSDVDIYTTAGMLINSVEWERVWEKATLRSYYMVIYRAEREVLTRGPGIDEITINTFEFDLQAKQVSLNYVAYIGHLRWYQNGVRQHPNRSGWSYYDGEALSLAQRYGINTEEADVIGHRSWWEATPGGSIRAETYTNTHTYGFDLTQQSMSWMIWAELQDYFTGHPLEAEGLVSGRYNVKVFGDLMNEDNFRPVLKVFRQSP